MKHNSIKQHIILGVVILVQLCLLVFMGTQKTGFNIDDILSYELANSYYMPFIELQEDFANNWHNADYLLKPITTSSETNFQYGSVYYNQTLDVHPPLYYAALHTIASFFPGVFSKWIGLSVNLLFFVATGILLFQLAKRLFSQRYLQLLPTILWGFSVGASSTFLLLRMYMMLSCLVALHLYLHLTYINQRKMTPLRIFLVLCTTGAGFLTHYYFLVFAFFLTLCECFLRLLKKDILQMFVYGLSTLAAVVLSFVVYPAAYYHIFAGYRGQESMASATNVSSYASHIVAVLTDMSFVTSLGFIFAIALFLLLFLWVVCKKCRNRFAKAIDRFMPSENESSIASLFLVIAPTLATFTTISILAGYSGARYLFFLYPLSALLCVLALWVLCSLFPVLQKTKHIILSIFISCLLVVSWCIETPIYFDTASGTAIANAQEYSSASCIFINDDTWKFVGHYMEFMQYDEVMFLKQADIETTLASIAPPSNETVLVYLPSNADSAAFLAAYNDAFSGTSHQIEPLWQYYYSSVYLLTPSL